MRSDASYMIFSTAMASAYLFGSWSAACIIAIIPIVSGLSGLLTWFAYRASAILFFIAAILVAMPLSTEARIRFAAEAGILNLEQWLIDGAPDEPPRTRVGLTGAAD